MVQALCSRFNSQQLPPIFYFHLNHFIFSVRRDVLSKARFCNFHWVWLIHMLWDCFKRYSGLLFSSKCSTWRAFCSKCPFNLLCPFLDATSHQPAEWYYQGIYCQYNWTPNRQLYHTEFNQHICISAFPAPILHLRVCSQCIYCWKWTIQWGVHYNNFRGWYVTLSFVSNSSVSAY